MNYPKNIGNTNVSEVELSPSKDSNLIWAITKYKKKVILYYFLFVDRIKKKQVRFLRISLEMVLRNNGMRNAAAVLMSRFWSRVIENRRGTCGVYALRGGMKKTAGSSTTSPW